ALGDRGQGHLVAFDLAHEKVLFSAPHESPSRMAISPDGQWIAGSTWNANSNIVRVWQVASGKPVAQWNSVNGSLLAFSPDSQRLIQSTLGGYQFRRVGTWEPEGEPLPAPASAHQSRLGRRCRPAGGRFARGRAVADRRQGDHGRHVRG